MANAFETQGLDWRYVGLQLWFVLTACYAILILIITQQKYGSLCCWISIIGATAASVLQPSGMIWYENDIFQDTMLSLAAK